MNFIKIYINIRGFVGYISFFKTRVKAVDDYTFFPLRERIKAGMLKKANSRAIMKFKKKMS